MSLADHNARVCASWPPDPPDKDYDDEEYDGLIRNELDLAKDWGIYRDGMTAKEARAEIEKSVYKSTACGAHISFGLSGVTTGSIVEGVEECTPSRYLAYPFTINDFFADLDQVELWATEIWNNTHGCPACGEEDPMTGYTRINPNCPECAGLGTIL